MRGVKRPFLSLVRNIAISALLFGVIMAGLGTIAQGLWSVSVWFPLVNSIALICLLPRSAAARSWPVIAGHCATASIGILLAMSIGPSLFAGWVAATLGIIAMLSIRAIHPPAAATALLFGMHPDPSVTMLVPILVGSVLVAGAGKCVRPLIIRVTAMPDMEPINNEVCEGL